MVMSLDRLIEMYNLKIKGVIHIGAHFGEEYADYARHGVKDMMFFEPVKKNFQILVASLPKDEQIKLYNLALGCQEGKMDMFTETWNHGQSCSLLEPKLHLTQYPHIKFDEKEEVTVIRLDHVEFDRSLYNMINMDVQGYELEVLIGGVATLPAIDIIYTEVNRAELYSHCVQVGELDNFLTQYGFERVETDWIGKTWGDALYLKR
jgi:FkbM family methyltransferase